MGGDVLVESCMYILISSHYCVYEDSYVNVSLVVLLVLCLISIHSLCTKFCVYTFIAIICLGSSPSPYSVHAQHIPLTTTTIYTGSQEAFQGPSKGEGQQVCPRPPKRAREEGRRGRPQLGT